MQVERLSCLPRYPDLDAGRAELIRALKESARSESHARRTIDALVRGERCATPGEIRDTAWSLLTDNERNTVGCDRCGGTGFISFVRNGYDCAAPCSCRPKPPAEAEPKKQSKPVKAGALAESWVK